MTDIEVHCFDFGLKVLNVLSKGYLFHEITLPLIKSSNEKPFSVILTFVYLTSVAFKNFLIPTYSYFVIGRFLLNRIYQPIQVL